MEETVSNRPKHFSQLPLSSRLPHSYLPGLFPNQETHDPSVSNPTQLQTAQLSSNDQGHIKSALQVTERGNKFSQGFSSRSRPIKADHQNKDAMRMTPQQSAWGPAGINTFLSTKYVDEIIADSNLQDEASHLPGFTRVPPKGYFGNRNQSVDVAAGRGVSVVIPSAPDHSTSQIAQIIQTEETNYGNVQRLVGQFIKGKVQHNSVTRRESQQRERTIKNTFQSVLTQRRKTGHEKPSLQFNPDLPGLVAPIREISVPKEFVLHQISRNVDSSTLEQSIFSANREQAEALSQQTLHQPSFLDHIPLSLLSKSPIEDLRKGTKTTQVNYTDEEQSMRNQEGRGQNSLIEVRKTSVSPEDPPQLPYRPSEAQEEIQNLNKAALSGAPINFISDLLQQSLGQENRQNYLKSVIENLKRQVKEDDELQGSKAVMIRNYRLHLVANDQDFDFCNLNKGTSIRVSNSIIRPEIHQFSTQVSNLISDVYPQLLPRGPESLLRDHKAQLQKKALGKRSKTVVPSHPADLDLAQPLEMAMDLEEEAEYLLKEDISRIGSQSKEERGAPRMDLGDLSESRLYSPSSAGDLDMMRKCERVFDRWLRNIISRKSEQPKAPPRSLLANGVPSALRIADINYHLALEEGLAFREKPIPLEQLTVRSFYDDQPYQHLQLLMVNQDVRDWYSKFVLRTQPVKPHRGQPVKDLQAMNFAESKVAIDFSRHHLTHLDEPVFINDSLPLELFVDFETDIKPLLQSFKTNTQDKELAEDAYQAALEGRTWIYDQNKTRIPVDVRILDYDPYTAKFFVVNKPHKFQAWRSRLFIEMPEEEEHDCVRLRKDVSERKANSLHYLRVHRLIYNEMLKRYHYIKISDNALQNIVQKLKVDLSLYNPDSIRKIILQIEALYVFSVLKATLGSQKMDPYIKRLLGQYKIPLESAALKSPMPLPVEKKQLKGIENYNLKGTKVELNHNSMLMTDPKYIKLPIFLNQLTMDTLGSQKLFKYPFNSNVLLANKPKQWRKISNDDLIASVTKLPMDPERFVVSQQIMSQSFHQTAKYKWAEAIQKEVWRFVQDDFEFDLGMKMTPDRIDPVLMRLFHQLKLYMQTVLFEFFENSLREYLSFLLSFILRDVEIRESQPIQELKNNPLVRINPSQNSMSKIEQGQVVNDIDLIKLRSTPLLHLFCQIEDVQGKKKMKKKKKIRTQPDFEHASSDMFSVIDDMHHALHQVDKIDKLVFPLLQTKQPYLEVPKIKENQSLDNLVKTLEKIIDLSFKSTKKELQTLNSFMPIFNKKTDTIIMHLKKLTFESQQMEESLDDKDEEDEETKEKEQAAADNEKNSDLASDDEDEGRDENNAANEMTYKSIDISDQLMKEEIINLRLICWQVLETVQDQYDYGLIYLDCTQFKEKILNHTKGLVAHLEDYLRHDFNQKFASIKQEIVMVEGKLEMEVKTIDDVIMLLDYINSLKKQGNKIADINSMIQELKSRMDYLEEAKVIFPDTLYFDFLDMRNWPRTFQAFIEERRAELLAKKDEMYRQMNQEILDVFEKIQNFRHIITKVLVQGLVDREFSDLGDPNFDEAAPSEGSQKSKGEGQGGVARTKTDERYRDPRGVTFKWLAEQIQMEYMRFDPDHIQEVFYEIENLKAAFDETERATVLINKREVLLGVTKTHFGELRLVQDDLTPLYDLWVVASKFGQVMPVWIEGKFEKLDAGSVEQKVEEWVNELKRLQKNPLLETQPKQQELQKFVYDSLLHFKQYGAMLRTLRTKGLATRHWRQIGQKLNVMIDPEKITLLDLVNMQLHEEDKLKTSKQICEIATKEYGVQVNLETLDKELRAIEFEFLTQGDGETVTISRLPDLLALYEEFSLRVGVLKTNPHIRNFFDKLLEIEKINKSVLELIQEWIVFQRNYIYLNSIFCLDEIAKSLPAEAKFFSQVQSIYTQTTMSFQANPQVYKITARDGFLNVLVRANQDCDLIRSGLGGFLERKRGKFPRMFFLSNEELVEIFGKGFNLIGTMIETGEQTFIPTLFEGIDRLKLDETTQEILGMQSKQMEYVQMVKPVLTRNLGVDSWMKNLENQMIFTLKDLIFLAFEHQGLQDTEEWITKWPAQAVYLACQLWFSMKMASIFGGTADLERAKHLALKNNLGEIEEESEEEEEIVDKSPVKLPNHKEGFEELQDKELEEEYKEERAFEDEVMRQVAKDEEICPEKAQLEKILRLKRRFRVNKTKSASKQMTRFNHTITAQLLELTQMVRKPLQTHVRLSTVALMTIHVHYRDILSDLIKDGVASPDDFKWQVQFKFDLKNLLEVVQKSAQDPPGAKRKLETHKLEVDFEVCGIVRSYGFEYLGACPRLVVTPLTERCQRSLLVALQYNYGGAPEGPFGTGKTETTKDLSRQLAKLCFVLNCSSNYEYNGVSRFFKGLASSGAWVCFDEFNRLEPHVLALVSQVVISIQTALRQQQPHLQLDEGKIPLRSDCAVFITLNPGYAGRSELPMNLKQLFRPVSMVVPDSLYITEVLLYAAGFVGAQQLAKKIVQVQGLADAVMSKVKISHDFGLRSIKAIVAMAEALKQNVQAVKESELAEVIDDLTLSQVPFKGEALVRETLAEHQGRGGQGASFIHGGNSLDFDHDKEKLKKNERVSALKIQGAIASEGAKDVIGENEEENEEQKQQVKLVNKGELENRLWDGMEMKERQRRSVIGQIGLELDGTYEEEQLEEYIVLKAVRDYNHSKFANEEHIMIEGAIKDVFQGAVPDLDRPVQDYGNLEEAIYQSFEESKLDFSRQLKQKALQMFEIQRSKHGCMVVGEAHSGKTTLINLLVSAINRAAKNLFMLAVAEERRARLLELVRESERQEHESTNQTEGKGQNQGGETGRRRGKRGEKENQAKKVLGKWQELYKQTKLSEDELDYIRSRLKIKGVTVRRLNPKALSREEMLGNFDTESHEWQEGVFTQHFRDFSLLNDDRWKWILLDGPIDYSWVENFNSVLDDSRFLNLANGETIRMSQNMSIILEADHLKNVTPATVSRCGLIFLHRAEMLESKAIFNKWLKSLPPNVSELAKDLDAIARYFMVEALTLYEDERQAKGKNDELVNLFWLMDNLVRLLNCFVFDFFVEYEKSQETASAGQDMGQSILALTLQRKWVDVALDPTQTVNLDAGEPITEDQAQQPNSETTPAPQPILLHSYHRVESPDERIRELEQKKRLSRCSFYDSSIRLENAIKFTPIWMEAFVIFAIVWTFHPVLSPQGRQTLDQKLREKYEAARTDFGAYQKDRKKRMAEKNKNQAAKQSDRGSKMGQGFSRQDFNPSQEKLQTEQQVSAGIENPPQNAHFSPTWWEEIEEKPMLVSDFPEHGSFYDFYFNLESSSWTKFNLEMAINDSQLSFNSLVPSLRKLQSFFVPSQENLRHLYIAECLITTQVSALVLGPAGSGKSTFVKEVLSSQLFNHTRNMGYEHITATYLTDSKRLRDNLERMMEYRQNKETGKRRLIPLNGNKLVCYVEDLHLSKTDVYGDKSAVEVIRDLLTSKQLLSVSKRKIRCVEDLSFFTCAQENAPETKKMSSRLLHQLHLIHLDEANQEKVYNIVAGLSEIMVLSWPSSSQIYAIDVASLLVEVAQRVKQRLLPSPLKVQYVFGWGEIFKILLSLTRAEANSLRRQEAVVKLLYHECLRTFGDRVLMTHDRDWLLSILQTSCKKHFAIVELDNLQEDRGEEPDNPTREERKWWDRFVWPIQNPNDLFYSTLNPDMEGFYMEITNQERIQPMIENTLHRYNDSNERVRLDLMVYNQLCRQLLRILRVISIPNGQLINVAMKGFGMKNLVKLAAFAGGHQLKEVEAHDNFDLEEWQDQLRQAAVSAATDDRHVTLYLDESTMTDDRMYQDLVCLFKNGIASDIIRSIDLPEAIKTIFEQQESERNASKGLSHHGSAGDQSKRSKTNSEQDQSPQTETVNLQDGKNNLTKHPEIQAQLYKTVVQRIKNKVHVILQFSPSGKDFRQRLIRHPELLSLCQVVFYADLNEQELESLGQSFFKLEYENELTKAVVEGRSPRQKEYSVTNDKQSQNRVLRAVVKMYLQTQEVAKKCAVRTGQIINITLSQFLLMFKTFRKLLKERKVVVNQIQERYSDGLKKLRESQDVIYKYHQELEARSPALEEQVRELIRLTKEIELEYERIKNQQDQLRRDEFEAEREVEEAVKIRDQCEETLNKIIPSLNEAMNSQQTINKFDLAELRSLKKPPKVIKIVMQVVCLLLGVPPATTISKRTKKPKLSYWQAALGKDVLGNPRLAEVLSDFDRNKLTAELMMEVEGALVSEHFSYEKAFAASAAALGIFKWVKATRDYFYIFKEIEPRRDAFMLAQRQYDEKVQQLASKRDKITHLDQALRALKEHQRSKDSVTDSLKDEIRDCSVRKKRADILLRGLSAEKQKWIVCTRLLASKYTTVIGDVLLSAGYISMIGPFTQTYRALLLREWSAACGGQGFECSAQFVFTELFGDSYKIRQWHNNQLPEDQISVNNALVVEKTSRFCLLIDPQAQGLTWLKAQFDDHQGTLTVARQGDYQIKRLVEVAIEMGRSLVVDDVGEHIGPTIRSLMKKETSKFNGRSIIQFCRKSYKYDKNFRLYVVTNASQPYFDVSITNHVTTLNFGVGIESLTAQLVSMVVSSERRDLEQNLLDSSKEAFEAIKQLKDAEATILTQLDQSVAELLGNNALIDSLGESRNIAEYVATKLRTIGQTNEFLSRAREVYAPVAFRAASLFQAVSDLCRVNPLYQFSLNWFKLVLGKSLKLSAAYRQQNTETDNKKSQTSSKQAGMRDEGLERILQQATQQMSQEEKIEFLNKVFTQELFRKLMIGIFDKDRKLVTYLITLRVLQAENFLDLNLTDFIIHGAKNTSNPISVPSEISDIEWMDGVVWAELNHLSTLPPFSATNLADHLIANRDQWLRLQASRSDTISFDDLPNKALLDLRYFSRQGDIYQVQGESTSVQGGQQSDVMSAGEGTANDSHSRLESRGRIRRSESEILNDPELWALSESDEGDGVSGPGHTFGMDAGEHEEAKEKVSAETEQVARFLVEDAPRFPGVDDASISDACKGMTTSERALIFRREKAVKGLCELSILRCIRPDLLFQAMDRFTFNLLDPQYVDFKADILIPLATKKGKFSQQESQAGQNHGTKSSIDQLSVSKSQVADGRRGSAESSQQRDSFGQGERRKTVVFDKREMREIVEGVQRYQKQINIKKASLYSSQQVIIEAVNDSDEKTPILILLSESMDVLQIINDFYMNDVSFGSQSKVQYFSMGEGVQAIVEERLFRAAQGGDWIILENLHLVPEWLPVLEEKLARWKGHDISPKFRLWLAAPSAQGLPSALVQRSVKVALQPPMSIQQKMHKALAPQEDQGFFRRSGRHANTHKNLFFALGYLHAILQGRRRYGIIGWNLAYQFDQSDFEVSNAQLEQTVKGQTSNLSSEIDLLRYFIANINYAGKIQRLDDQNILNAFVCDLFNENIVSAQELPPDPKNSHFGFPREQGALMEFVTDMPQIDGYEILGFDWRIETQLQKKQIFEILDQIQKVSASTTYPSSGKNAANSIEINVFRTKQKTRSTHTANSISEMESDSQSLLSLFASLQRILLKSSFNQQRSNIGVRYDQLKDQEFLVELDHADRLLAQTARTLATRLDACFDQSEIEKKFPIKYKSPINNVLNRELASYRSLLHAMGETVTEMAECLDERDRRVEDMSAALFSNSVPDRWLRFSFQTGKTSLADYIISLSLRIQFWKELLENGPDETPSFWLGAFFDPKAFLNAQAQTRARTEAIPLKEIANVFEVTDFFKKETVTEEKNTMYIHGLWLEGAEWDNERKQLVESNKSSRFVQFPSIKVKTIRIERLRIEAERRGSISPLRGSISPLKMIEENPIPRLTGVPRQKSVRIMGKLKQFQLQYAYFYRCPIYKSTLRLSKEQGNMEAQAVDFIKLESECAQMKWVKRAVALLLETEKTD